MSKMKVPFYKNVCTLDEVKALIGPLADWDLSNGAIVKEFEDDFAKFIGSKYAVAVSSATAGIFLLYQYIKPEFISIPSMTFVSVANMAVHSNVPTKFEDRIDVGGVCPIYLGPNEFAYETILDCAHQITPNMYKCIAGQPAVFSFYPTKNIASCEGGMIATDDEHLAKWLRKARLHGMEREGYSWDYTVEFIGWKMNMNGLQAALAKKQLEQYEELNEARNRIVARYNEAFERENIGNHLYRLNIVDRPKFMQEMANKGIECSVHFKPIHKQPAYIKAGWVLPITDEIAKKTVSLPLWPQMDTEDVDYVITNVINYFKQYGKYSEAK